MISPLHTNYKKRDKSENTKINKKKHTHTYAYMYIFFRQRQLCNL